MLAAIAATSTPMTNTILMILKTFFTGLLLFNFCGRLCGRGLFGEIFFIYDYNIGFFAEAPKREDGDNDGKGGDDGGDSAGDGEPTGGENGADQGSEQGGAASGTASAEGDQTGDEAGAAEVFGVFGVVFAFFVPEEDDEPDEDALQDRDGKNREPVEERLVDAKNSDEAV